MKHVFLETIPDVIEPDTLYISLDYNVAVHKCASGCGFDVVTPLSPAEWSITYNGHAVSLRPSIGNWGLPCRSHYYITNGEVRWAKPMTAAQIAAVRQRDDEDRAREYGSPYEHPATEGKVSQPAQKVLWRRLFSWLR